jgi:hypothetical protein
MGRIVRRLLFYLGLALAGLAAFALLFAISVRTGIVFPFRWVALAMYTSILFYAVAKPFRNLWKHAPFWFSLGGLTVVHVLAFSLVLRVYPQWPLLWYIPVIAVEAILFSTILDMLFTWRPKRPYHKANAGDNKS